jgi:hypothetical protein
MGLEKECGNTWDRASQPGETYESILRELEKACWSDPRGFQLCLQEMIVIVVEFSILAVFSWGLESLNDPCIEMWFPVDSVSREYCSSVLNACKRGHPDYCDQLNADPGR